MCLQQEIKSSQLLNNCSFIFDEVKNRWPLLIVPKLIELFFL